MKNIIDKLKNKKVVGLLVSIMIVIIILMNSTYSLLLREDETEDMSYTTGMLSITSSATNGSIPVEDSVGMSSTAYTFKITNTGNLIYQFDVKLLSMTTENQIDANYIKVSIDGGEPVVLGSLTNGIIKEDIVLLPGGSIDVSLKAWLDINTSNTEIGKTFTGKITTEGQANYTATISDTVIALANEENCKENTVGVCPTNSYINDDGYTRYHDYRYRGAEPNNYVWFNNDMYQIIGAFDDNSHGVTEEYLVKLIPANVLMYTSWGVYNSDKTSGTYSNYQNDWTGTDTGVKANLNVLLNEFFYPKNNVSSVYGNCADWTYYSINTKYRTNDCTDIIGYGINSTYRNYIEDTTWYLYGYSGNGLSKQNFYLCERGLYSNCKSGNSGVYDKSTTAKVGLMYVSDYLYASAYFVDTDTTSVSSSYGIQNWIYQGTEWLITPYSYGKSAFRVDNTSSVSYHDMVDAETGHGNLGLGVRPTFYLKSTVYVTGGDGSFDNPYTISM